MVKRIYDDIERSGGKTWRYDQDNMSPADFKEQYKSVLANSDYFILIDTPAARGSKIVQDECTWALAALKDPKTRLKEIIVCLGEKEGCWRKVNNPLDSLNYNYVNFSELDRIDPFSKYRLEAIKLCDHLGLKYYSWSKTPRAEDFRIELFDQSHNHVPKEQKDILLNDYKSYELSTLHFDRLLPQRLNMMIEFCKKTGVKIISLFLAKGIFEANTGNFKASNETLIKGVQAFPEEPRLWAALGTSYFYLAQYEEALQAYKMAEIEIIKKPEIIHNQQRLGDLYHNIVETLITLKRLDEAVVVIENIDRNKEALPEIRIVKTKLLLHQHRFAEAKNTYTQLAYLWETRHFNELWLNKSLGSLEYMLCQFVFNQADQIPGKRHYERALTLDPENKHYVYPPA